MAIPTVKRVSTVSEMVGLTQETTLTPGQIVHLDDAGFYAWAPNDDRAPLDTLRYAGRGGNWLQVGPPDVTTGGVTPEIGGVIQPAIPFVY